MLKRITTAGVALAAMGAFALGGSVIASAKPATHAKRHAAHSRFRSHAVGTAEAPSTETDAPGGADVQSGDQTAPDNTSATAAATGSDGSAEAPSTEADGPGGHQDPPGANSDVQQEGQN